MLARSSRSPASDGLYELNLPYPTRKISRTCWKAFDSQACPYAGHGALDLVHFPDADANSSATRITTRRTGASRTG